MTSKYLNEIFYIGEKIKNKIQGYKKNIILHSSFIYGPHVKLEGGKIKKILLWLKKGVWGTK